MTQQELEARGIARAHEQHVYIRRTARDGVYSTVSKSNPRERYILVNKGGVQACSCRGFEYRRSCKHVEALRNRLAREAARRPARPAAQISDLYPAA